MRRRQVIGLLGAAAVWPLAARAQKIGLRRIGVVSVYAEGDPEGEIRL